MVNRPKVEQATDHLEYLSGRSGRSSLTPPLWPWWIRSRDGLGSPTFTRAMPFTGRSLH